MAELICHAHMHPLPCPGYDCRTTDNQLFVDIMQEYRAEVAAGTRPPWIWELRAALGSCRGWLRRQQGDEHCATSTLEQAEARIADLRRAGWTGDDQIIWNAGASMAKFNGAMPFLPQRACELREVEQWRELRKSRLG